MGESIRKHFVVFLTRRAPRSPPRQCWHAVRPGSFNHPHPTDQITFPWGEGGRRNERKCFLIDSPNRRQNPLFILVHRVWRNEFGNTYMIHVAIAIADSRHNSTSRLSLFFPARIPRSDGPVSPAAPPTRGNNHHNMKKKFV